ncbi:CBF-domain-containing protein [Choiromyces venosus 120613-1]|uniref:CBF-domain-containing protein n=1 Tax=Choiromyces venosus 120613-1 TaxID=1336337 RepID=A0A3N4JMC2_9PEZI|nr:CBF-domain-containing protein [Choiromyces venosus 120613-1]
MVPKPSKQKAEIAEKLSTHRKERTKKVAVLKRKRTELVKQTSELQQKQTADEIEGLEKEIVASPRGYNHIVKILEYLKSPEKTTISAAVTSLCRAFIKLMAKGELSKRKKATDAEVQILEWLRGQYKTFVGELCELLNYNDGGIQEEVLWLLMRLVKAESEYLTPPGEEAYFPHKLFQRVVEVLLYAENLEDYVRIQFVEKYLDVYDDIRYSFFAAIKLLTQTALKTPSTLPQFTKTTITLILSLRNLPTSTTPPFESFFAITPPTTTSTTNPRTILTLAPHRKLLQTTILHLLRLPTIPPHTSSILQNITTLAPAFPNPETLMDFLTDTYSTGGPTALLALSGLFYLIKTKNLDYPNFYQNLYALVDRNLLHLKYRSRFFRLLEEFLGSKYLPAALIASFIKRLARLALSAPPAAIVVIVPFVYNLLKAHSACWFMVHREGTLEELDEWRKEGVIDPFDPEEEDPLKTGALDSCLWELETLRGHWQPNVATLARILGEQFTKASYGLEDFLDHSYGSMFAAEIKKNVNPERPPVVEFEVPKRIFSEVERGEGEELAEVKVNPLLSLWKF